MGIYEPAEAKSLAKGSNKKIPLHTLICANNRIKTLM